MDFKKIYSYWRVLVIISLFTIMITLAIELFMSLTEQQLNTVHMIDAIAVLILIIDLGYLISRAKNKIKFVLENWLLILSFLPYASFTRVFRYVKVFAGRTERYAKALKVWLESPRLFRFFRSIGVVISDYKKKLKEFVTKITKMIKSKFKK